MAIAFILTATATASVGPGANLLDRNRGWVIDHADIHNIFWDSNWSKHNPWSRHAINEATLQLINGGYA